MSRSDDDPRRVLDHLSSGCFLMTSAHEARRAGVVVTSIQKCAEQPPLICVSSRKGHVIETLIRDSRRFAICRIDDGDKLTIRRFTHPRVPETRHDPFDAIEVDHLVSHAPVLRRSTLAIDCEVFRHFDLEADHELYIGQVLATRLGPARH